jgi:hypothetical protein
VRLDGLHRRDDRDVDADHGALLPDLRALNREHGPVPVALIMGSHFSILDDVIRTRSRHWSATSVRGIAPTGPML